jgi:hypothetical protein
MQNSFDAQGLCQDNMNTADAILHRIFQPSVEDRKYLNCWFQLTFFLGNYSRGSPYCGIILYYLRLLCRIENQMKEKGPLQRWPATN